MRSSTGSSPECGSRTDVYAAPRSAIAAVALASAAALFARPLWLGIAAANTVLILLLAFDVWRTPHPRGLVVERDVPPVLTMRREGTVTLKVRNDSGRPLSIVLRDATPPSGARTPRLHEARIPPASVAKIEGRVVPGRRGSLLLGPLTVRVAGPLSLGGRQATIPVMDTIKVYPELPGRAEVELRLERARMLQSGQRSSLFRGGGTEFDSLREYHPDDEFRRINWTATARAAKPITNLFREERNQQVLLLLDASRAMAGTVAGVTRFEHALDAAMALAELAARVGDHVGVLAFASRVQVMLAPRGGRSQPQRILDTLFDRQPSLEAPDYRGAFGALLSRHRRRSLLVLFTELTEESAMESLFTALPVLLPRHLLTVGAIMDPEVVALRSGHPASFEDAYLAAAAAQSLAARDRASRRLRAMGAVVEDRAPGRLSGAIVDRYLQIKSAGRL